MTIDEQYVLIERLIDEFANKMTELLGPLDIPRYLLFESLHPQKKPRGSIRRNRKRRRVYAKDGFEIGKALYEGMMDGFGIEEDKKGVGQNDE